MSRSPRPAKRLADGYQVIRRLSLGRDLEVYDAWSSERSCRCVIKRCRPDRANAVLEKQLLDEGNLLLTFSHMHLVRAYDVQLEPVPLIVLETLSGMTIESMFGALREAGKRMTLSNLSVMLTQISSAVRYLHSNQLLHLDLKPSNVIVEAGRAKVIDLSLAHASGVGPAGWGTRSHMAPEQAAGELFTTACDVWALGLLAYEALSGVNPFLDDGASRNASGTTRPYRQITGSAPPIETHRRVPSMVAEVINSSLSSKPIDRPTVTEFADVFYGINPDPTLATITR